MFRKIEYETLIAKDVFILIHQSDFRLKRQRIFKFRMINKVKEKEITKPYEKFNLII